MDEIEELRAILNAEAKGGLDTVALRIQLAQAEQIKRVADALE